MHKNLIIGIIPLLLLSLVSHAQNPSIDSMESRTEKIEKVRSLLLDAIIDGDKVKAVEIRNYLTELEDSNYVSIYPDENWLINYWIGEYEEILNSIVSYDSAYISTFYTRINPQEGILYQKLKELIRSKASNILSLIESSKLSQQDKDFVMLHFKYLIFYYDYDYPEISRDSLNTSSNIFLDKYDQSVYEDYIREYIRFQYKSPDWGVGVELFSGYGIFTKELSTKFKNNVPIGLSIDINYKKFFLYLRGYIGFSKTLDSIRFKSVTWHKNAQAEIFLPEASMGYVLYDKHFLKITPFVGISSTDISPTEDDIDKFPEYDDVGLNYTTTYTYGLNLDLIPGSGLILDGSEEIGYWFIRIRYAYNQPQFNKKYNGFNGDFHYITIGIGGFGRILKRDY